MIASLTPQMLERAYANLTERERKELDHHLSKIEKLWEPIPGPQQQALDSKADVVGFGGAAGGGKTDLAVGMGLTLHERTLIVRREKAQTEGIVQRMEEIVGSRQGYSSQKSIWRFLRGRIVEFGGCDNLGDEKRWQGRPHDLKVFDEVTEQREAQVRFIMGWNRTSNPDIKPRTLMTFNPPTTTDGRWVLDYFGPWINKKHPNPAEPGELRWYTTVKDEDLEVPDGRPFVLVKGDRVYEFDERDYPPEDIRVPKSRTFIPSRVTDNPYYMKTGYIDTLNAMPEPLRSQMLYGDFNAGVEDDVWQVIPTAWVEAAMDRWQPRDAKGEMDTMGVDVARGGRDFTVLAPRHGVWFDDLVRIKGQQTPDGQTVAGQVVMHRRDGAVINIDVVGWGASPYDFLMENEVQCWAVNGAAASREKADENGLSFKNLRAQLWWRMREALNPKNKTPIYLPDDSQLLSDLTAPLWKMTPGGIQIESKEDIIKRIGRSPDDGDAVVMALAPQIKNRVFEDEVSSSGNYDRYRE